MRRILILVYKDLLVLVRDWAGLILLFLMPMSLVVIMTALQDTSFRSVNESGIKLILLNNDSDSLGNAIEKEITASQYFNPDTLIKGERPSVQEIKKAVAAGRYQIGLVIPANATRQVREHVKKNMEKLMSGNSQPEEKADSIFIALYVDPAIRSSIRSSLQGTIMGFSSRIENRIFLNELTTEINKQTPMTVGNLNLLQSQTVACKEEYIGYRNTSAIPNSVQHNVPSWMLFAMFFIVIPFAGSMIKEREDGNLSRLLTMPASYTSVTIARMIVYLFVCLLQFALITLMGIHLFPLINLPALNVGTKTIDLTVMALFASLAAICYGIVIGTIAQTHQQAAIFGSVSTMILAALGGTWVPVFMMPPFLRSLSIISPMNWALNGFYDILVRNAGLADVLHYGIRLFLFAFFCLLLALYYNRIRKELT